MKDLVVRTLAELKLVDWHCHFLFAGSIVIDRFELYCSEADPPAPAGVSYLDSAVGLAIRRWCAPVLVSLPSWNRADWSILRFTKWFGWRPSPASGVRRD